MRGPWVCSEYYRDPQPDKFRDGWLVTGDIAAVDPEKYLIIADRSKDLVKSGGEWISSVDLENHIVGLEGGGTGGSRRPSRIRSGTSGRRPRRPLPGRRADRSPRHRALRGAVREVAAPRRGALSRFASPHLDRQARQEGGPRGARGRRATGSRTCAGRRTPPRRQGRLEGGAARDSRAATGDPLRPGAAHRRRALRPP